MAKIYINGIGSVSCLDHTLPISENLPVEAVVNSAKKVNYKEYISPAQARRMAKGVKMGVYAANQALNEAKFTNPEAIITGSGMGCLIDSEKFLTNILDNAEEFLTPTSFIQSTHNTVGGQVALGLGCKSYNVTYVHESTSFESALLDAMLKIQFEGENNILIGGVDEIAKISTELYQKVDHIKENDENPTILNNASKGAIFGEGAQFFALQKESNDSTYCEIVDSMIIDSLFDSTIDTHLQTFLNTNGIESSQIDALLLGYNGDVQFDGAYDKFKEYGFDNSSIAYYKHLTGEYNTSSAFGMYLGARIIKNQKIPANTIIDDNSKSEIDYLLIYNQYRGENHTFTLLKKC